MTATQTAKTTTQNVSAELLTSAKLVGGQDKYRIVGRLLDGTAYEVGPYDTEPRANGEAKKLAPVSDGAPEVLVILTCSSVNAIVKYAEKVAKPAKAEAVKPEADKPEDAKPEETAKPETAETAKPVAKTDAKPEAAKPVAKPRQPVRKAASDAGGGRA